MKHNPAMLLAAILAAAGDLAVRLPFERLNQEHGSRGPGRRRRHKFKPSHFGKHAKQRKCGQLH